MRNRKLSHVKIRGWRNSSIFFLTRIEELVYCDMDCWKEIGPQSKIQQKEGASQESGLSALDY